ncbi:F14D16.4 [Arabidopsis thaliana]|uniref:F14D16.4 n=1 Tax=Arabidopsis thaliana TaxID=3702 RepID=Q9LMD8_ARATH|nr:F14D16.4 [Arabidopsis thaliana]
MGLDDGPYNGHPSLFITFFLLLGQIGSIHWIKNKIMFMSEINLQLEERKIVKDK